MTDRRLLVVTIFGQKCRRCQGIDSEYPTCPKCCPKNKKLGLLIIGGSTFESNEIKTT